MNPMKALCIEESGQKKVLQGNIAFAAGCVRSGIHAVDGYPGTPSSEVIDKGLSQVQDMIDVGWSVSEAVSVGVAHGYSLSGKDCVVTMKIPGLYQAGDPFTSLATFTAQRGALVFYIASDFTPSSTQHVIDPRPLYKSCFVPVFEPRNHQELHESAKLAADISREHKTAVVVHTSGILCHSEGLVELNDIETRELAEAAPLKQQNALPNVARANYDKTMEERMPALLEMVEKSPLNIHIKGTGKRGVITSGVNSIYMEEYKERFDKDIDILSLGFTNPLPMEKIREFCESIEGDVYVVEDGYRHIQEACNAAGLDVIGKPEFSRITEWTPHTIAEFLGHSVEQRAVEAAPIPRPPMICAGCPYRLFGEVVSKMKKRGALEGIFGDIGCNTLLYFMNALDTGLAMGQSEAKRCGYVMSKPEAASKCISVIGDGTECHSGLDSTRNTVFRDVPGVKVVLDNEWIAMTGGQPGPTSPVNLAGTPNKFDLVASLKAHGTNVVEVNAYDLKDIRKSLKEALAAADEGAFTVLVIKGTCIRKVPRSAFGQKLTVDTEKCVGCGACNICPGVNLDENDSPVWNNICSGCVSNTPACMQMCPKKAISIAPAKAKKAAGGAKPEVAAPEEIIIPETNNELPERLALAIRGVGGQGNLFFGKVLAQMAFLAGYDSANIVKGETHGMAQMGGPVISTFGCGTVYSPNFIPGTADVLIAMEKSEILRPGFLEMLKPDGVVLMAETAILPQGFDAEAYPSDEVLDKQADGAKIIKLDALKSAIELGDRSGRSANVVMLGALSSLSPFNAIPSEVWLKALQKVSPTPAIWAANEAAFNKGTTLVK